MLQFITITKTTKTTLFVALMAMKPNPFTKEALGPEDLVGRKEELAAFSSAFDSAAKKKPVILLITGSKGIGKTALLRRAAEMARHARAITVFVRVRKKERVSSLVRRLLEEACSACSEMTARKILPPSTEKSLEECAKKANRIENATVGGSFTALYEGIVDLHKIVVKGALPSIVFFIDDVEHIEHYNDFLTSLAGMVNNIATNGLQCMFVLSAVSSDCAAEPCEVVKLRGLSEHEAKELVGKLLKETKVRIGNECMKSILADCEGHPTILLTVCWVLFDRLGEREKLITKGHYLAHSNAVMSALAREIFDDVYQATAPAERAILRTMAKTELTRVSEIAKRMKKPLNVITRLVLRLTASGNLTRIERGRYRIFNRLYARYILTSL